MMGLVMSRNQGRTSAEARQTANMQAALKVANEHSEQVATAVTLLRWCLPWKVFLSLCLCMNESAAVAQTGQRFSMLGVVGGGIVLNAALLNHIHPAVGFGHNFQDSQDQLRKLKLTHFNTKTDRKEQPEKI